jgi:hypothetical protein
MAEELPFAGVACDAKEKKCKIWWLATIKGSSCTIEVEIPNITKQEMELRFEDDFKNSIAKTEGRCDIERD